MKRKEIFIETKNWNEQFYSEDGFENCLFLFIIIFFNSISFKIQEKNIVSLHTIIIPFIRLMLPVFLKRFDIIVITIHLEILSKRYSSPFSSSSTFLIQISRSRLKTFPAKDLENVQFDSHPQTIILTQYSFFFTITDGNYRIIRWAREHRGKRTGKKNDLVREWKAIEGCIAFRNLVPRKIMDKVLFNESMGCIWRRWWF